MNVYESKYLAFPILAGASSTTPVLQYGLDYLLIPGRDRAHAELCTAITEAYHSYCFAAKANELLGCSDSDTTRVVT